MIEPLTHEEYQRVVRETLAPTLEYKAKWLALKKQIIDEIEQNRRIGRDDTDYRYHDALEAILNMMENLE